MSGKKMELMFEAVSAMKAYYYSTLFWHYYASENEIAFEDHR